MNNYVVFDYETSELLVNDSDAEIIYINAFKINNNEIIDKLEIYSKPSKPLDEFALEHITLDKTKINNGVTETELVTKFIDFTKDYIIVNYNVNFFMKFLSKCMINNNLVYSSIPYIDYRTLSKRFYQENNKPLKLKEILELNNIDIPTSELDQNLLFVKLINDKVIKEEKILDHKIPTKFYYEVNNTKVSNFKILYKGYICQIDLEYKEDKKTTKAINDIIINDKLITFDELYEINKDIMIICHIGFLPNKCKIKKAYIYSSTNISSLSKELINDYINGINYAIDNNINIDIMGVKNILFNEFKKIDLETCNKLQSYLDK